MLQQDHPHAAGARAHDVIAAQNSLDTLEGDVAAVIRALGRVSSPAILVGHSYGGTVITAAGTDNRVAGLVYIAALAPNNDETSQSLVNKFPTTEVFSHIEVADGRIWLRPGGIGSFAGDLSEEEQRVVWATQGVPAANLFDQKMEGTAWRSKPSWYIVAKNDRTVHPDLERFVAKRMVAVGVHPGGGGTERLPHLVGRGRALEIVLGANDFDGDTAERYGYVNRALPDGELDGFVDVLARRVASFDRRAIAAAKNLVTQVSLPSADRLLDALNSFQTALMWPEAQQRIQALLESGLQRDRDFKNRWPTLLGRLFER